jgi:PPK2 family polyphosphate:nucleotide phosphotransferase
VKKETAKLIDRLMDRVIVPPGKKVSLKKDYDPGHLPKTIDKAKANEMLQDGVELLAEMQDKLYAQDRWAVLVVFQAMDAAGKDGTIKHVMSGLNPQGCQVYSFKAPSSEELDHSYLWRCFKALPERGRIGIFNRSYYEEVLITKVHPEIIRSQKLPEQFKDKKIYERRYEEINNFEKYLSNNGVKVVKFFLNVSKAEQKKRFLERIDLPDKNWKFSATDAKERGHWNDYMEAYEDCFNATSTKWAPWHVIPADNKWFMRLAVAGVIYKALHDLDLAYPEVTKAQKASLQEAKKILTSEGR